MAPLVIFLLFFLFVAVASLIGIYNRFVKYKNGIEEAWSGIDVALKRRSSLIPNLIRTIEGYSQHEASLFRTKGDYLTGAANIPNRVEEESRISETLRGLLGLAEAYPDLKASANFIALHNTLDEVEEDIQKARNRYNRFVGRFNTLVESFPAVFIARRFGFEKQSYFALELATQRELPEIEFSGVQDALKGAAETTGATQRRAGRDDQGGEG